MTKAAPDGLTPANAQKRFITEGPNSGGIAGWLLNEGHMHQFYQDFGSGKVFDGVPIATWLERYAERHPDIAAVLENALKDNATQSQEG